MSRSSINLTRKGLAYRYIGPHRYECCRCRVVVRGDWSGSAGWYHVCAPQLGDYDRDHARFDANASLQEQYEALALFFTALAERQIKLDEGGF